MTLKDKVIVVTGASSGIGRACVKQFVSEGAFVVLASRSAELLDEVAASCNVSGGRTLVVPTDVTDAVQCQALMEKTVAAFGRIDILVNNAGVSMRASFLEVDLPVLHRLMDVNYWGTVYCTRFALPYIIASKGTVVGVTSVAAHIGLPGRTGYSASKFAMRGFLDTIRNEYLDSGVNILTVAPGFTESNVRFAALTADGSPQMHTPRDEDDMMSSEEVAESISYAIRHRRRSVVLTFVEGRLAVFLNKWFPSLVSWLVSRKMHREPGSPV